MNKCYCGNLPFQVDEQELRSCFEEYGAVDSVDIIIDKYTGKSRGFAFVTYQSSSSVQKAIDGLNEKDFKGRNLRVSLAREKTDRQRR